ncbi:hypothetical protein [Flavobacterium sp. UBA7663]|uniref:hypothetical protein n=1 Tax=Flavobacterium sp. UBA7663 TaxID=1946557 RepID=UPI0025C6AAAC|nr:hypothetical protein [Flavobacterium sp. UBA7663]
MKVGAVLSMIVNVAEVVEVFPQSSVAVNVTVAEPVAPHVSETDAKLFAPSYIRTNIRSHSATVGS